MTRWLRLLIAVLVIAALVVVLIVVRRAGENELPAGPVDSSSDRVSMLDIPWESITEILVEHPDDRLVLTADANATFVPEYRYDVLFSDSRISRVIGSFTSLMSERMIDEQPEALQPYGLSEPAVRVTATLSDADPVTVLVGSRTPGGDAYYVQTSRSATVYSVSSLWISPFFYSIDDLRDKTVPQLNPQTLEEIEIRTVAGRTVRATTMAEDDEDPEMSLAAMAITEPYSRRYQVSPTWIDSVMEALPSVGILRYVDDDPQELQSYGLDPARAGLRVRDVDNELHLILGEATSDGRYGRFADGGSVFVVRGVEELISITPYETISPFMFIVNIDLVDSIVVESASDTYVATIQRAPGESDDDDPVETFSLDGEELEDGVFRDLYQWLIGLQLDAEIREPASGAPEVSITYHLNTGGPAVLLEFVPQNSNYYSVYRDGASEFVVTRTKIQRLLAALADPSSIE
ncbi:MAG: DUF4340 domain-containing protein [Spirochaetales bacterium]|nr:DUF4340 domain-containing protein [Spirochaetales bacterium]